MKIFGWLSRIIGGNPVLMVLGALLAVLTWKVAEAELLKGKLAKAVSTADSLQIDAMNERAMNNKVVSYLRDSITRVSIKQVVQVRPHRDTVVAATIAMHVEPIHGELVDSLPRALTVTDTMVRHDFHFPLEQRPFHGALHVAVIGREARLEYQIGLEPAQFRARIACGAPLPPQQLRPATLALQGPAWLVIDNVEVQSVPGACNAPRIQKEKFSLVRRYWWVPPVLTLTYLLGRSL